MANLLNYLDTIHDQTFDDRPLNEIDYLVLTEVGYLPFNELLSQSFDLSKGIALGELARAFFKKYGYKPFSPTACKNRINLLKKVMMAKRYQNIITCAFIDDVDKEEEKQFSAITFQLMSKQFLIAFRGTDDSLIGWKESFYMTYKAEIPAQTAASQYLQQAINHLNGHYILSGHSKGGSLAIFAGSSLSPKDQNKLIAIHTYDSPGLHPNMISKKSFDTIQQRITAFIPQDSVVGQLLENPYRTIVVHSKTWGPGLFQHDTFTWQIGNQAFIRLASVSKGSLQVNRALNIWLDNLKPRHLQRSFDDSFDLLFHSNIEDLGDLSPKTLIAVLRQFMALSKFKRRFLLAIIGRFFSLYFKIVAKDIFALPQQLFKKLVHDS